MSGPVDQYARAQALDPRKSFICEAPAGSGKTELLTQRVLTLLACVDKPEAILAITFTRKAAAEMRDRILTALNSALGSEPEEEHARHTWHLAQRVLNRDQQLSWDILKNPNRLQIRTFDSLCSMLTQTLPLQSLMGSDVRVCQTPELLYQEAVTELMLTLESEVPWVSALSGLLAHMDNRYQRVEQLLMDMLSKRDAWMPIISLSEESSVLRQHFESHLRSAIYDKQALIAQFIPSPLMKSICSFAAFAAENVSAQDISSPLNALKNIDMDETAIGADLSHEQWLGVRALLLTGTGGWRKKLDKRCGFPAGEGKDEKLIFKQKKQDMLALIGSLTTQEGLQDQLKDILYWPEPRYRDEQWLILENLSMVLPVLVAQLQLIFKRHGEVDFLEMSFRARHALGTDENPTDLALRLDTKIEHILTDEFQDTSFTQVELLQKLTVGWQQGDGRTLFCVGDAMQSIYAFRGANVGLFLHCKVYGLGDIHLEPIQLTSNFRSQAGIVEWVNDTFSKAFPKKNDISSGAVTFSKADAFKGMDSQPAVQSYLFPKGQGANVEGEKIVEIIQKAQFESPSTSVAILVRSKKHAQSSVIALKKAGIRFKAVDLDPLSTQALIQDLQSLTMALLFVEDRIAWLSVLRAPWCGLCLSDLLVVSQQLQSGKSELVLSQVTACLASAQSRALLSADGLVRLERVYCVLSQAISERERKPLRTWVEGVWLYLGGASCLDSMADSENALRYFDYLEALSASGEALTAKILSDGVSKLFSAPDPDADDRIQIMSIHKSKGLEFDVVILPGLSKSSKGQDTELLLWQERLSASGEDECLLAAVTEYGQGKDSVYTYLEHEKASKEKLESCRLLYVACTRAKKHLYLLAEIKKRDDEDQIYAPPPQRSLISPIWSTIASSLQTQFIEPIDEEYSPVHTLVDRNGIERLPSHWRLPEFPIGNLLASFIAPADFDNRYLNERFLRPQSFIAQSVGTLIHQLLELIGRQGLELWRTKDLQKMKPFWLARLHSLGCLQSDAEVAVLDVLSCVQTALKSPYFEWLMAGDCRYEYALSTPTEKGLDHHVMDLLRIGSDGAALIVDYKTSKPLDGESIDVFMLREKEKYRPQLERYESLASRLGYRSMSSSLFFVALDRHLSC